MPDKHPYANVNGGLVQLLDQLRKTLPPQVDADLLKKLAIAPKNESYIINVVRFLGLIDEDGKRTEVASKIFTLHEDEAFHDAFAELVKKAYSGLFNIHGEGTWTQTDGKLISYFRQADQSSQIVGGRQASTFKTLATYAGRSNDSIPTPKPKPPKQKAVSAAVNKPPAAKVRSNGSGSAGGPNDGDRRISLTVRMEINLPAGGDQATYDKIFKSIRENLMNG